MLTEREREREVFGIYINSTKLDDDKQNKSTKQLIDKKSSPPPNVWNKRRLWNLIENIQSWIIQSVYCVEFFYSVCSCNHTRTRARMRVREWMNKNYRNVLALLKTNPIKNTLIRKSVVMSIFEDGKNVFSQFQFETFKFHLNGQTHRIWCKT